MEAFKKAVLESRRLFPAEEGDYIGENGLLYCGKCHTKKEHVVRFFEDAEPVRVGVLCACGRAEKEAEERRMAEKSRLYEASRLRRDGVADRAYASYTFENDDKKHPAASEACRAYVARWDEMREKNTGMLLYGPKGTGKTFLACAVANALLEKLVPACVTSFPEILNRLSRRDADRQEYIDRLCGYALLVVDDLGAERDTPYASEQVYNVIDSRLRARLPLIVTTNLTLSDLENETDIRYARIYDRILSLCPLQLCLAGESRRRANRKG